MPEISTYDLSIPKGSLRTYSEIVSGVIDLGVEVDGTFTQNSFGQYTGLRMNNSVIMKSSNISVEGDVVGSVSKMNVDFNFDSDDRPEGVKVLNTACSGYISLAVSGEQMVCGLLSSCDGCE